MRKADNFNPGKWLVENKITTQSRLNEDEKLPTRLEIFNDFKKMAQDLEAKTGAEISVVTWPDQFRFHVAGEPMIGWWDGQFDIRITRRNPSAHIIKKAYDDANEWVSSFPEKYKDYLSWKAKGEEALNQEISRRKKEKYGE
jgi:hypothetical protein